jgi:hypothetical protein
MERELRIYEMSDAANPTALAHSRLPHGHDDLWSFIMLLDAPATSEPPFPS